MARVTWSPQAASDLESICDFIARDSIVFARLTAKRVIETAERAARFPKSGRVVPEIDDANLREKIVGNYRLIYRLKPGRIEIVTVIHGARSPEAEDMK
jgi:plasmid stabilization system protein ParE